jgi:hypothetical protein
MAYKLALCNIYNNKFHGKNEKLQGYVLCEMIYKKNTNFIKEFKGSKNSYTSSFRRAYHDDTLKPEIVEIRYLDSGECICCLKTFWIAIFQRLWRKFVKKIKSLQYLRKRELGLLNHF